MINRYKYKLVLLLFVGLSNLCSAQKLPELNVSVVQNDFTVGGQFAVKVQIRSGGSDFTLGNSNFRIVYSTDALSFDSLQSLNFDSLDLSKSLGYSSATYADNLDLPSPGLSTFSYNINLLIANLADTVSSSWMDVGILHFTILDNTLDPNIYFKPKDAAASNTVIFEGDNSTLFTTANTPDWDKVIFDGTSWSQGNGPGGIPDATDAAKQIEVLSGTATLTSDVQCTYFTVASGAKLNVSPNSTLRPFIQDGAMKYSIADGVDGFIIDADNTGYGQYIGPGLTGTIKQYVGTNPGWRNIGFPVSGATDLYFGGISPGYSSASTSYSVSPDCKGSWGNTLNNVSIYRFNKGVEDHEWYGVATMPSGGTEGYSVFTGSSNFGMTGLASVKGTFLDPTTVSDYSYQHSAPHASGSGSQSSVSQGGGCISEIPADRMANWDGWALLANPYPCNLSVDQFCSDNSITNTNIRIWDEGSQTYISRNGASIAPMQGFWIKLGTAGDPSSNIVFNDVRTFSSASFYKTNQTPGVELEVINVASNRSDNISLKFNGSASKGYDKEFDTYNILQPGDSMPNLSFHNTYLGANNNLVVAPLSINQVPYPLVGDNYPLRFSCITSGQHIFSAANSNLFPGMNIFIEDLKTTPGVRYDITNANYSFTYDAVNDGAERFILHFSNSIGINEDEIQNEINDPFIYVDESALNVVFRDLENHPSEIRIFDMAGRMINRREYQNTPQNDSFVLPTAGVYIVNIVDNKTNNVYSYKALK